MTITLAIGAAFVVGALVSAVLDRIEAHLQRRRDDKAFSEFWRDHIVQPYDVGGPR
ncbi:MAG TPA: hypothetical protein VIJ31_12075 [Acidothermaceae bacterium]